MNQPEYPECFEYFIVSSLIKYTGMNNQYFLYLYGKKIKNQTIYTYFYITYVSSQN